MPAGPDGAKQGADDYLVANGPVAFAALVAAAGPVTKPVRKRRQHRAAGATRSIEAPAYPASHNLGSNRMSARAEDGVVDRWGCSHEVLNLFVSDGSQFASGGACNPTLTIVALAIRQAGEIARRMTACDL